MDTDAVGDFASDAAHDGIHGGHMDRDLGMLDRSRIEQRHHQVDVVVLALHVQRHAVLPAVPDRANGRHILAHPWAGRRPGEAVATLDMRLHLRAEAEREAAMTQLLDRPRAERGHGRAAREGDRDRGAELQRARCLCGQRHQDERIVLGLLDHQAVVADLLEQPGIAADRAEVERHFGRPQPGIDLAERQQRLEMHGAYAAFLTSDAISVSRLSTCSGFWPPRLTITRSTPISA